MRELVGPHVPPTEWPIKAPPLAPAPPLMPSLPPHQGGRSTGKQGDDTGQKKREKKKKKSGVAPGRDKADIILHDSDTHVWARNRKCISMVTPGGSLLTRLLIYAPGALKRLISAVQLTPYCVRPAALVKSLGGAPCCLS